MRYILLTILLSVAMSVYATDELVVSQTSGETVWAVSSIKDITFDGNGVKVSFNDDTSVYYSKSTLNMLKFNVTSSGINDLSDNSTPKISINGNIITVDGNVSEIKVYSLAGIVVAQGKGSQIDISGLTDGAYIVQAGSLITKIMKR